MEEGRLRWDDIEIFCLIAEFGSIRQAGAQCGQSVETIRRRINALEVALGERLFRRTAHGLAITQAGTEILADARRARDAVRAISRSAGADSAKRLRRLRISLPEDLGGLCLLPALLQSLGQPPDCVIQSDLRFPGDRPDWNKTDIALQFERPEHSDLICRKVGTLRYALYCRIDFRDELSPIEFEHRIVESPLILPQDPHPFVQRLKADDHWVRRVDSAFLRVDSVSCVLTMLSDMDALAALPSIPIVNAAALCRLPEGLAPSITADIWVAFHDDVRQSAPARQVLNLLAELAGSYSDLTTDEPQVANRMGF